MFEEWCQNNAKYKAKKQHFFNNSLYFLIVSCFEKNTPHIHFPTLYFKNTTLQV